MAVHCTVQDDFLPVFNFPVYFLFSFLIPLFFFALPPLLMNVRAAQLWYRHGAVHVNSLTY